MPISELYKDRSIVPDALAFPNRGRTSGGTGIVSFQNELTNYVTTQTTIVQTDTQHVQNAVESAMLSMTNAERRAKHWVGEYERVGRWDIQGDVVITTNTNDPVQFNTEVIRIMGAEFNGTAGTGGAKWRYICPPDAEGIYLVESFILYTLTAGMACSRARFATFIDGIQWSILDTIDRNYAGENPMLDLKLSGCDLVPLKAGQELTIQTFINASSAADQTLTYSASVYGRVNIVRTRCDQEGSGNGKRVNSPASGNLYVWNNI